jgi:hypothetical protein
MNKVELVSKIDDLKRKIKTRGRAYSIVQRDEFRKEIAALQFELNKFISEEEIEYIRIFLQDNPTLLNPESEDLKNKVDRMAETIVDPHLIYVLKFKITRFFSEFNHFKNQQNSIRDLLEAKNFIDNGERIPVSNPNKYKKSHEIQKNLAGYIKGIKAIFEGLKSSFNEIEVIVSFFNSDDDINGFVYLSNAIFSDASNFEKGYSVVKQGLKEMYFTFNGGKYNIDGGEMHLPSNKITRINPDLVPFEIYDGYYNKLMGYKNENNAVVIPATFKDASPFVNGFAKVSREVTIVGGKFIKRGIIDHTGKFVLHFENPFFEIDDVYNDIVKYKRHIYGPDSYEEVSFFSDEVRDKVNYRGLFSGYLIFSKIRAALFDEIANVFAIQNELSSLRLAKEVDVAKQKLKRYKENIDFYLAYITNRDKF